MLWLKCNQNEAPVMNEIKAPNKRIKLKIKNDQVGNVEKGFFDTSQLQLIEMPHWSHQFVARGRGIENLLIT